MKDDRETEPVTLSDLTIDDIQGRIKELQELDAMGEDASPKQELVFMWQFLASVRREQRLVETLELIAHGEASSWPDCSSRKAALAALDTYHNRRRGPDAAGLEPKCDQPAPTIYAGDERVRNLEKAFGLWAKRPHYVASFANYAGGVSKNHKSEPSDSVLPTPDGSVMGVLPTPAPEDSSKFGYGPRCYGFPCGCAGCNSVGRSESSVMGDSVSLAATLTLTRPRYTSNQSEIPLCVEVPLSIKISGILDETPHQYQLYAIMKAFAPYLRKPEPVSLGKCADAAVVGLKKAIGVIVSNNKPGIIIAKAVLHAAGVKYHED